MSIKTHRVLLHFKIEDTITESVHILANLDYGNWVFYLFGVWFSSEVLDFFFYLSSSPSIFHTNHQKHSEDCTTVLFFYGKNQRCKMNTQGCDMKSWVGVCRAISQTMLGQWQWGVRGVTTPALPCWVLLWEEHTEKKLQHKRALMLYVKYVERAPGVQ